MYFNKYLYNLEELKAKQNNINLQNKEEWRTYEEEDCGRGAETLK